MNARFGADQRRRYANFSSARMMSARIPGMGSASTSAALVKGYPTTPSYQESEKATDACNAGIYIH